MTLNGISVYVSGVAGHYLLADRCDLVLHWRLGDLRVSTVGGRRDGETVGYDRWSETMVFRVSDANGVPEGEVTDWNGITTTRARDSKNTRHAEAVHHEVARRIAELLACTPTPTDDEIAAAVVSAQVKADEEACPDCKGERSLFDAATRSIVECFCVEDERLARACDPRAKP